MKVAELYAVFGFKPDLASLTQVNKAVKQVRYGLMSIGSYFGGAFLGKSLIGFNSKVEDSKNQIAGMLALAKKSNFADEIGNAGKMYDGLRQKAAELPGSTQDYVDMLGMLVQPLANAGVQMQAMQDITVGTMIAARGLGEGTQKAARDVSEFVNFGKFNAVDTFIRRMLEPMGYKATDEQKKAFKAMSQAQRAEIWKTATEQKQVLQMAEAQANSFSGKLDQAKENIAQFLGAIGKPLFDSLKGLLQGLSDWWKKNKTEIEAVATAIGGGLVAAFDAVRGVLGWFADDLDKVYAALWVVMALLATFAWRVVLAWGAALGPIALVAGALWGVAYVFQKLRGIIGDLATAMAALWSVKYMVKYTKQLRGVIAAMGGKGAGAAAAAAGGVMKTAMMTVHAARVVVNGGIGVGGGVGGALGGVGGAAGAAGGAAGTAAAAAKARAIGVVSLGAAPVVASRMAKVATMFGVAAKVALRAAPWIAAASTVDELLFDGKGTAAVTDFLTSEGDFVKSMRESFGTGQVLNGGVAGSGGVTNAPTTNINISGMDQAGTIANAVKRAVQEQQDIQYRALIFAYPKRGG